MADSHQAFADNIRDPPVTVATTDTQLPDAMPASNDQYAPTQHNLRRIVGLRAISIGMQILLISIAMLWLDLPLPVMPLALILLTQSGWNLFTWWRARQSRPVSDGEFFFQLLTDALAFTAVLFFTGGATNPFVWFYLLPLMIAATVLPTRYVWGMAGITIACYSLLVGIYIPLQQTAPMAHMPASNGFSQHVFGMWFGFTFSAVLVSYFVTNMAHTLRDRDRVLAEAREQALRDERLVALGTLAAGAAHELGTPLGTMALVVDDLLLDVNDANLDTCADKNNVELRDQLQLIRGQINRCKDALSVISASAGKQRADEGLSLTVDGYLVQLCKQWQLERPGIHFSQQLNGPQPAPQILADRALTQALSNILNNAADASPESVELRANWDAKTLEVHVLDRGPGLSEAAANAAGRTQFSSKEQGLGVGLFLAHAVIERLGGSVSHRRRETGGTCTCIHLPIIEPRP